MSSTPTARGPAAIDVGVRVAFPLVPVLALLAVLGGCHDDGVEVEAREVTVRPGQAIALLLRVPPASPQAPQSTAPSTTLSTAPTVPGHSDVVVPLTVTQATSVKLTVAEGSAKVRVRDPGVAATGTAAALYQTATGERPLVAAFRRSDGATGCRDFEALAFVERFPLAAADLCLDGAAVFGADRVAAPLTASTWSAAANASPVASPRMIPVRIVGGSLLEANPQWDDWWALARRQMGVNRVGLDLSVTTQDGESPGDVSESAATGCAYARQEGWKPQGGAILTIAFVQELTLGSGGAAIGGLWCPVDSVAIVSVSAGLPETPLHELGHALGLSHPSDRFDGRTTNLMNDQPADDQPAPRRWLTVGQAYRANFGQNSLLWTGCTTFPDPARCHCDLPCPSDAFDIRRGK